MTQATLEFSSRTENLAVMRGFIRRFLQGQSVPEEDAELLVLGVDEACTNIVRHAYGHAPPQPILLSCERNEGTIRFRLRDYAPYVEPARFNRLPQDPLSPGGLGLHLMERIFDEIEYHPQSPGTELVMTKCIGCFS